MDTTSSGETCSSFEKSEAMEGVGGLGLARYFFLDLVLLMDFSADSLIGLVTVDAEIVPFSVDSTSNVLMRSRGGFRLSIAKAGSKKIR